MKLTGISGLLLRDFQRGRSVAGTILRKTGLRKSSLRSHLSPPGSSNSFISFCAILGALLFLLSPSTARAQVAVDASTSGSASLTGAGIETLTVAHTTTATANRVLIVGVAINITNNTATAVSGVTYNGTALTLIGAHNDAGNTRRVEMWYQLAPANGNHNVVVSVNVPTAVTVGVVAGATTFTGVDQTTPLGTFVSADGAAAAYSELDVPSVVNGMILDTLAIEGDETITIPGPQVSQWNARSSNNANPGIRASGSSRTGAPSVPVSETFSGNSNWSEGAISINPTSADIAVMTSLGSAVFLGQNTTYNITVTNNGTSTANNVVLTDTWPTASLTTVSITPSAGTTCTAAPPPITCTLPATLAAGATATVAVVVKASASGAYANTASVTDSGTPPDPDTANNSFTAVATVQSASCANVSQAAPGSSPLTGVLNTYYPGTASVAAGATSIKIGAGTGGAGGTPTAIAAGNLLLVIQMQDASISTSNTVDYGNDSTGQGFTALNSAGDYEFVTAANNVGTGGGTLNITGSGTGGGLVFGYDASPETASKGQSTFQVILVPQYTTATLATTGLTASPWNGSTGGVLVLDASQTLTLNGATVVMDGMGFRGGAGLQLSGTPNPAPPVLPASTDFLQTAPGTYTATAVGSGTTTAQIGWDAPKGEGIAGTPAWVESNQTFLSTGTGYPSGGTAATFNLTAVANAAGGDTVYTGTVTGGANNAFVGYLFVIKGFTNNANNGTFTCVASTATTLTLSNAAGVAQAGATATATFSGALGEFNLTSVANAAGGDTVYTGTITGGANNALAGYIFVVQGFANAANNGTFASTASSATTLTLTNAAGVAQAGTATVSLDGSMGRGAPGNAGGGATDADPQTASEGGNDQNAGGGGGGNGGAGGFGGDSWNTNLSVGGEGGAAFPATVTRVAMGGGGGAGSRNNSNGDNQASGGAAGGGIIIIRAYALSGTATLTANGASAYNATLNDAGGGGGAGGSIVVLSANGGESGLTLQANGGSGGNAWEVEPYSLANRHGPGGGGGGGVVLVSGTPASISVTGGADGLTENPGVSYGSTAGAAGFSVTNASITQTSGTQSGAECTPDMTVAKSHVGNFTRGLTASYTVTASNISSYGSTSGTVIVNDTLPTGINPTSASGTGWTCSLASQTVSCVDSTVLGAASSYPAITINANVAQSAPSTVANTAIVGGGGEVNLSNDTATDVASVVSSADLSVSNTASPNPVAAGSSITYAQVLTNNGPSAADNATLVEAVPANTTFVSLSSPSGWNCTTPAVGGTGNILCTNVTLAGSTAATFSLVVKVNAGTASGTVVTDTATASSSTADPNSTNNTASASTLVGTTALAEMTVTNSASPDPVIAGNDITYTQTATNVGAASATNPSMVETTPPNTTFVSITTPPGTTCTPALAVGATGSTTCTAAAAPAGSAGTVTFVVQVNAGTASGTVINDTVTVNSTNQAFGSNSAIAMDVVATAGQADLALTTTATPLTLLAGNDITYTQTVTNNGPAAATNVSFTEAIPANTTFVSVSAPVGWSCTETTSVTCTISSLAASASADIIVAFNVAPTVAAGTITATSSVSSSTSDPYSPNNSTSVSTPLIDECNLTVKNIGSPSPVTAGSNITYTQTISNSGPSNCSTATFTEATPANTTFVSVAAVTTGGGTWTCPNSAPISCTNPSVPPGSVATITAVYTVNAGTAAGTIITDTATASSATPDSNFADNSATSTIGVASAAEADLSVTNTGSPNPVNAGQNITFSQTVGNAGPAASSTVTLTETLPANTTFVSLGGSAGWTCTATVPYTCTIASLAANATGTFTFVVKVTATVASGTAISDTASVASSVTVDPNNGNNSASSTVYVADSADLAVTNAASPVPVIAGNNITYTQVVTNNGPSAATNATFTETTPANTTFFSLAPIPGGWSCTLPAVGSAGTISCSDPSFAAGTASFPAVLKVTAGTPAGTAINDTATVSSSTSDPNTSNNSATAADVVATAAQADLVTTNIAAPTSIASGSNVTYTQSVTNNGPSATTAGTATFTQTTPPNTTFQGITPPATGWTCTTPAIGGTGTITCTATGTLGVNATANFTLLLQVNSGTPSGTNIPEITTASAGNVVPNLTTNSATATVIVANANSADMAIVKTASPSPTVPDGDTLTYTLAVTNNGPATATTVTVIDTLPSDVTYLSSTTTQGTCSEADATVTCLLGTMNNAGTATVTILTLAGSPGTVTNTATVSADQTDPNQTNNTSSQTETITASTKIQLHALAARMVQDKTGATRVAIFWKTGAESHNLGFNVYREENGERVRLNSSLVAGSALMMSGALPKHSGKTYTWIDSSSGAGSGAYWLEDVDVNGTRTMHGPVAVDSNAKALSADEVPATAQMFSQLNQSQPAASSSSHRVEALLRDFQPTQIQRQVQFELAANPAVKIYVQHEGWHQVTQAELVQSGLDPNVDPALLHLYAEGLEQPIKIVSASPGRGGFGPQAAIQFYGTGIDTPYSGTRVYWLVAGGAPGLRIPQLPLSVGSNQAPVSFPAAVEITPRTTYFSALITNNGNNFFGPLVSTTPLDETLTTSHFDQNSADSAQLEVILQGVVLGFPHDVSVAINGTTLGDLTFTGEDKGTFTVSLPPGALQEGDNTVTLTSQDGDYDMSLVQSIGIRYPHSYIADSDGLKFTGTSGDEVKITGFTSKPIIVLDITDPQRPVQLTPQITSNNTSDPTQYEVQVQVPWSTTALSAGNSHTLIALGPDHIDSVAGVSPNHPSNWHSSQPGSEIVMVSPAAFAPSLTPLVRSHQAQGKSTVLVSISDIYDEFSFGEHTPYAIRDFLYTATKNWRTPPHYLLLNGRASLDPRNYLGFGYLDFVPTKIVPVTGMMTASDDWFSDFTGTGMPTIATGRLPVSTPEEANLVAGKLSVYESKSATGAWTSQALMVADVNDMENFTKDSKLVQTQLPSTIHANDVFGSTMSIPQAQQDIVADIDSGQLLVNYSGHGSEEQWSGDDLFDNTAATALTNGSSLPVFLIMDCLNGFFQDVYEQPLAVTLMLAPNGGAVAVLASSGLNQPSPQTTFDKLIVQNAFNPPYPALGDAILKAKSGITDLSVRKTFNLLGDPAMQVKSPTQ